MTSATSAEGNPDRDAARWVRQAQEGDQEAFARLVRRYAQRLAVLVAIKSDGALARHMDVADLLQDIYLRVFERIGSFDSTKGEGVYPWIAGIARNVILECRRKYVKTQKRNARTVSMDGGARVAAGGAPLVLELPSSDPTPSRVTISRDRIARTVEALEHLPENQRQIVWELLFEGRTGREVAAAHGVTPGTVSKYLARAMIQLGSAISHD